MADNLSAAQQGSTVFANEGQTLNVCDNHNVRSGNYVPSSVSSSAALTDFCMVMVLALRHLGAKWFGLLYLLQISPSAGQA